MLEHLDLDDVAWIFGILRPEFEGREAHSIQRHGGQPRAVVGELFRIRKAAAQPLDDSDAPPAIVGRANMARRKRLQNANPITRAKTGLDGICSRRAHHRSPRSASSAIFSPSSAIVNAPR